MNRDDSRLYVRHTGGARWGVGVLVGQTRDQRTYLFADGVRRAFKEAFCSRFIVPAEPPCAEDEERLRRGLAAGGIGTPRAIHLALEAQIAERPDDPAAYLVYADWLQQHEDPRGKLIAIQDRLARATGNEAVVLREAERALLDEHGPYFLPEQLHALLRLPRRRGEDPRTRCEVEWQLGYLAGVRLARRPAQSHPEVPALVEELLGHPSAHLLRRLVIGPLGTFDEYNYLPIVEAIARRGHGRLAELDLGDFGPEMELAFSRAGNASPLFDAAPALERLRLRAGTLRFESAIAHGALRELSVIAATLSPGNVRRVLEAELPVLESLELSCPGLELTDTAFRQLLRGVTMPRLRRLALRHSVATLGVLDEILGSPLLPQLEVLELDHGDLGDREAEAIAATRASRLAHLRRLNLDGNPMSEAAARRLARVCSRVEAAPGTRGALAEDDVIARAPDARSLTAARAIAGAERWIAVGRDHDRVWGEYDGSDNYYVWARLGSHEAGCNCPSAKDPCKHVLALLLMASQDDLPARPIPDAFVRRMYERPRVPTDGGTARA